MTTSETELSLTGTVAIDALGFVDWINDALGLTVTAYSRPSDGVMRYIGDLTAANKKAIAALLAKHDKASLTAPASFPADGVATTAVTLTVSDQASGLFDVLVYLEDDKENAITESVTLSGNAGTLTIGPAAVPGVYIVERSDGDYFARVRVEAV